MQRLALFTLIFSGFSIYSLDAQSTDLDKKIGAESAQMVEESMGIYPDESMTNYVAEVGNRLIAELGEQPFEFSFRIADTDVPNAFALPGGYTFITRGLLALINTEDELAGVMGHEIIHAHRRHSIKQMRKEVLPALLKIPGEIVGFISHCLLYTSPSPRDATLSRMPSSA